MKRLLLIDDDTVFLNLLERALSSYAQVSIASSVHAFDCITTVGCYLLRYQYARWNGYRYI